MSAKFRVIDSGVTDGRQQIAFDQALIDLHKENKVPNTVRFLRFPPTVLIGRHQVIDHEVNLEFCRSNKIGLVRRITGGGAIYLDEGQLGWELVLDRQSLPVGTLPEIAQTICEAVAHGLSHRFNIEARFRPRNDIEVEGRKLCGTGGFFDGRSLIYQGTVLIDMNPEIMVSSLNVPKIKLAKRALDSAEQRVTTLKQLLNRDATVEEVQDAVLEGLKQKLGISLENGEITEQEFALADQYYEEEIGTDDFVYEITLPEGGEVSSATEQTPGGIISAYIRFENNNTHIREILYTGDFFVAPPRIIFDLEARLRGLKLDDVEQTIRAFFENSEIEMLTIKPDDFIAITKLAIENSIKN